MNGICGRHGYRYSIVILASKCIKCMLSGFSVLTICPCSFATISCKSETAHSCRRCYQKTEIFSVLSWQSEKPWRRSLLCMYCMYVKNVYEVYLYMNVGTKPSMSVCYICAYTLHMKYDLFDLINDPRQDSCTAVSCSLFCWVKNEALIFSWCIN